MSIYFTDFYPLESTTGVEGSALSTSLERAIELRLYKWADSLPEFFLPKGVSIIDWSTRSYTLPGDNSISLYQNGAGLTFGVTYSVAIPTKNGLTVNVDSNGNITTSGTAWSSGLEVFNIIANYSGTDYNIPVTIRKNTASDGVVVELLNETEIVVAQSDGTGYTLPSVNEYKLYSNGSEITSGVTYSGGGTANGLTAVIDASTGIITVYGDSWTSDSETFTFTSTYLGTPRNLTYTITKSKVGASTILPVVKYTTITALGDSTGANYTIPHSANGWSLTVPTNPSDLATLYKATLTVLSYDSELTTDVDWSNYTIEFAAGNTKGALVPVVTNSLHSFPTILNEDGTRTITSYANSGTDFLIYYGTEPLEYDGVGTTSGTYKVEYSYSYGGSITVTPGTFSAVDGNARLEDYVSISGLTRFSSTFGAIYLVTGVNTSGQPFTLQVRHTLFASRSNATWRLSLSSPVLSKASAARTINGAFSSIKITGYDSEDTYSANTGWLRINGITLPGTTTILLANLDLEAYALANPSNPEYTFTPPSTDQYDRYDVYLLREDPGTGPTLLASDIADVQYLQIVYEGAPGVSAILSNDSFQFNASPDGVVSGTTGSGTTVTVLDGPNSLIYNSNSASYPSTNGRFNISLTPSGITPGSISGSGTATATISAASAVSSGVSEPYIDINIYGRTNAGVTFLLTKRQTFTKSLATRTHELRLSADTISKQSPDATTSGTYSSITIGGYRLDGNVASRFGWVTNTPNTGSESSRTSVSSSDFTLNTASNSGISSYLIRLYDAAVSGNLIASKTVNVVFNGLDSLYLEASNSNVTVDCDYGGNPSSLAGTGSIIRLYEGTNELTYVASGVTAGTWTITSRTVTTGSATLGTITDNGTFATVNPVSALGTDLVTITYVISAQTRGGRPMTINWVQNISKVKDARPVLRVDSTRTVAALPVSAAGVVDYSLSSTLLRLYEGDTELVHDGIGTGVGKWTVTAAVQSGTISTLGTKSTSGSGALYTSVSGMSTDTASIQFTITGTYLLGGTFTIRTNLNLSKVTDGTPGTDGDPGVNAKAIVLSSDRQTFTFDGLGTLSPGTQSAVVTANLQNIVNATTWSYSDNLGTASGTLAASVTGSGNSRTIPSSLFTGTPTRVWVKATVTGSSTESTISDSVTIVRLDAGSSALSAVLTNETASIPTASDGSGASLPGGATGSMLVYYGTTDVTELATFSEVSEVGGTGTISNTAGTKGDYSISTLTADTFTYTMRAVYNGSSIDKVFTVVKNKAGINGTNGTNGSNGSRTAFITLYQWSTTTPTAFPTTAVFSYTWATSTATLTSGSLGSWSLDIGTGTAGQKLWRIAQAVSNSTTEATTTGIAWSSTSVFSIGAQGTNGERGSRTFYRAITGSTWSGTEANTAITSASLTAVTLDIVTLYNTTAGYSETRYYNGGSPVTSNSSWTSVAQVIDGNLLVTGSVGAQSLNIDGVTLKAVGDTLVVDDISATSGTFTDSLNITGVAKVNGTGANTLGTGFNAAFEVSTTSATIGIASVTTGTSKYAAWFETDGTSSAFPAVYINAPNGARAITVDTGNCLFQDNIDVGGVIFAKSGTGLTSTNQGLSSGGHVDTIGSFRSVGSASSNLPVADDGIEMFYSDSTDVGTIAVGTRTTGAAFSSYGTLNLTAQTIVFKQAPGVAIPNGTVSTPGLHFDGTTDTGIYRIASASLGISCGGTVRMTVNTNSTILNNRLRLVQETPVSASASGTTGDITVDANYIYVCTATNTWKRAALSTW